MVPPEPRLPQVRRLVEQFGYFAVHAPRQTGKTTTLRSLAKMLTAETKYAALHFSCEAAESAGDDYEAAQRTLLAELERHAQIDLPPNLQPPTPWPIEAPKGALIAASLTAWARVCQKPIVLFLDEVDALRGTSQEAVLRQLRAGFPSRPDAFPAAVAIAGLREVGRRQTEEGAERTSSMSPFNIKLQSARIGDFTEAEVWQLYGQHTAETGQSFSKGALIRAWELTLGQPWLVNALAHEIIEEMRVHPPDEITERHFDEAKERLIRTRSMHLDHLVMQLTEPRVERVVEPLLAGTFDGEGQTYEEDVRYCRELGLVSRQRPLQIANPIYSETVARALASFAEDRVPVDEPKELCDLDGKLEFEDIFKAFSSFWMTHGVDLARRMSYPALGPQLVLMAFVQRVIDSKGYMDRVFGVGRGRIELLLRWPFEGTFGERAWQKEGVVITNWETGRPDPLSEALPQTERYLDNHKLDHGALVIFDRRDDAPTVTTRTGFKKIKTPAGRIIVVLRA